MCMLYICWTSSTPHEVETSIGIESADEKQEDGEVLDEDVEDDVHTDKDDHDI